MRNVPRRVKAVVAVAAAAAVVVSGGAAWALWRISGDGNTSAKAGQSIALEVSGTTYPVESLYPGASSKIQVTVTNRNAFPIVVTRVKPGPGPATVDPAHQAGCVNSGVAVPNATYGVAWEVPKKSTKSFVLSNGIKMTNASDSGCQGATFSVSLMVTGRSVP